MKKETDIKDQTLNERAGGRPLPDPPYDNFRMTEETMNYLWSIFDGPESHDAKYKLAGNISKSMYIKDKDDWFYNTVLKEMAEYVWYKNWENYYKVHVAKSKPPPVFKLEELWVNYQKQYEFNPPHFHGGTYSFVLFMKIPTHWKEQHALPVSANSTAPEASNFQFLLPQHPHSSEVGEDVMTLDIPLSPEDEGRMLFFPASMTHQVFPFYGSEEERITVSGNIFLK